MKKLLLAGLLLFSDAHLFAHDANATKCITQEQFNAWHDTVENARQKQSTASLVPTILNPVLFATSGLLSTCIGEKGVWLLQTLFPVSLQLINLWAMPIARGAILHQNANNVNSIESELNAMPLCSKLTNTTRYEINPIDAAILQNKLHEYQDALEQAKTTNTLSGGITAPLLFIASLPLFYILFNFNKLNQHNLQIQDISNDYQLQQELQGQQKPRLNVNVSRRYGILSLIVSLMIIGINSAQDAATMLKGSAFGSALDVAAKPTV